MSQPLDIVRKYINRKSTKEYGRPFIEHLKEHLQLQNQNKIKALVLEVPIPQTNSPSEWTWDPYLHREINFLMSKAYKEGLTLDEKAYLSSLMPKPKPRFNNYRGSNRYGKKQPLSER